MKYKKGKILAVLLSGALLGAQMPGAALTGEAAGYTGGMAYTAECGYEAEGGTEAVSQTVSEGLKAVPKTMAAEPEAETGTEEESSGEKTTGAAKPKTTESANGPETGTTVPEKTTTAPEETITAPEKTTAAPEKTTATPEETITAPEKTTTVPEETTTVPEETTTVPEETTTAPEKTTTAPEETTTVPEETVTGPETGTAGPTETQTADPEESETDPEESGTETEESETESPEGKTDAETGTSPEKTAAKRKGAAEKAPDSDAEAETDKAVSEVQAMIDALPSVEEVKRMSPEEQKEVYDAAQDAADAYFDGLTEDQQEQVDTARLEELMNYFNGQVSTMAAGYTLTDGVLTITSSEGLISFVSDQNIKSITITGDVIGSIGDHAFYNCSNLESVTIKQGANITSIGKDAFYNCKKLISVTVENGATIGSIGEDAFDSCSVLDSVTLPSGLTSIGAYAFQNCSGLTSITIPGSVTSIGAYAFKACSGLTSITISEGVTSIGEKAFYQCSGLESITIPDSVESIGNYAFDSCSSLESITIPDSVTSIGVRAFQYCSGLTSITIPGSVTSIGEKAFYYCSGLTSITISEGVESIGADAFYYCSGLTSITIPDSVTSIGGTAFSGCSSLTEVTLPATAPSVGLQPFWKLWNKINFIIPETSIGTGNGQYNLNATWSSIEILNGSSLIRSRVAVTLTEPEVGIILPTPASCTTTGVANSSVSWTLDGSSVADDAKAEYGKSYTAEITLTAKTSTDTSVVPHGYRFVDGITTTLNGTAVTATVSDSGKTLTISKTWQMPKKLQDSPKLSIDYQKETLNTTVDMEYRADNGGSWSGCSADMGVAGLGWDGAEKAVQIRMKETEDAYASEPASVTIPARPAVTVSQVTGSTTAGSLTVQADGVPQGAEVQYQLVADGGSIDNGKWQESGKFTNLSADTAYTAYAKCTATDSSFASGSSLQVRTSAASYTVGIPSTTLTAGDSTSTVTISVSESGQSHFDLGCNGRVQVKVQSGGAVSQDGKLTLTRQGDSGTITSAMLVNGEAFTDITQPVAEFTMSNYKAQGAGKTVSFAQPTGTQAAIPAGTYSGTVVFVVSYSEGEVETE